MHCSLESQSSFNKHKFQKRPEPYKTYRPCTYVREKTMFHLTFQFPSSWTTYLILSYRKKEGKKGHVLTKFMSHLGSNLPVPSISISPSDWNLESRERNPIYKFTHQPLTDGTISLPPPSPPLPPPPPLLIRLTNNPQGLLTFRRRRQILPSRLGNQNIIFDSYTSYRVVCWEDGGVDVGCYFGVLEMDFG